MPKKPALRLFTKTWPPKKKDDEDEPPRPLTATLEKPTILDISFIKKIDMTLITKEFLLLTNLCKIPLTIKIPLKDDFGVARNGIINRFENAPNIKHSKRLPLHGDVGYKKIKTASVVAKSKSAQTSSVPKITDPNNNNSKSLKKCEKAVAHRIKAAPLNFKGKLLRSNKLPEPCTTCGRPDQPERFHSHPINNPSKSTRKMDGNPKLQVKSTVQKPIAIKYKSKFTDSKLSERVPIKTMATPTQTTSKPLSRPSSGKRTLTCPICSREFGTASLPLHEPKCLEKWERENSSLPPHLRRKMPVKPDANFTQEEWNDYAWQISQALLVPCRNCKRTFYPDRLRVHQRSCRTPTKNDKLSLKQSSLQSFDSENQNVDRRTMKRSPKTDGSASSDSNSVSFLPRPTTNHKSRNAISVAEDGKKSAPKPPSVVCYICGRLFGTHSIKIHESQCLKKWRTQNSLLPPHQRKPTPKKIDTGQMTSPKDSCDAIFEQKENSRRKESSATNTKRPPTFPCYLCGREFSVNSIYIHEPQCLKKWRIENEKLPPEKRKPEPLKPDIKFTPSGEVDYVGTFHRIWENHLAELVPCKICGRKFFPDRIEKHEQACNGLGIKLKNKK